MSASNINDPFLTNVSAPQPGAPPTQGGYATFQPSTRGSGGAAPASFSQGSPQGSYGQPPQQGYPQGPYGQPPQQQALLPPRPLGPGDITVAQDPFMAHARPGTAALVENDPFLTHDRRFFGKKAPGQSSLNGFGSSVAAAACCAPCAEVVQEIEILMGVSDPDATPWCGFMYVFIPYAVFLFTLFLLLVVQHFSHMIAVVVLAALVLTACVLIAFGVTGAAHGGGSLSWITLGCLCLLGFGMGLVAGQVAWQTGGVRQSWWFSRGKHYSEITAATDARSVIDAASVEFDANSKVDTQSSVGYNVGGETFCVAPVLDDTAATSLKRVQFWAVGLDCCDGVGGFKCDESRQASAHKGVVMLDGGNPCPGCNARKFEDAVSKAEALHNLVSSDGALLVRWVSDTERFRTWLIARVCLFLLASCWLAFLVLAILGHFANQFGWGRSNYSRPKAASSSMWGFPDEHQDLASYRRYEESRDMFSGLEDDGIVDHRRYAHPR